MFIPAFFTKGYLIFFPAKEFQGRQIQVSIAERVMKEGGFGGGRGRGGGRGGGRGFGGGGRGGGMIDLYWVGEAKVCKGKNDVRYSQFWSRVDWSFG